MKAKLLLFLLPLLFSGCASFYNDVAKVIPPGNYAVLNGTVTGKFSSTQFTGEHVTITPEGKMTGGHVHFRHSDVYIPLIEVDIQSEVESPAAK